MPRSSREAGGQLPGAALACPRRAGGSPLVTAMAFATAVSCVRLSESGSSWMPSSAATSFARPWSTALGRPLLVDDLDDAAREPVPSALRHGLLRGKEHGVVDGGAVVRLGYARSLLVNTRARVNAGERTLICSMRATSTIVDAQPVRGASACGCSGEAGPARALHYSTVTRLREGCADGRRQQPRSRAT